MKRFSGTTIDEYIGACPAGTRKVLKRMRALVGKAAPGATEKISYGLPTFFLDGNLVHFGGFERHVGFYPGPDTITAFAKELRPYETSKGTVQFPLDEPLPEDLVRRMVEFRVAAQEQKRRGKAKAKRAPKRPTARRG